MRPVSVVLSPVHSASAASAIVSIGSQIEVSFTMLVPLLIRSVKIDRCGASVFSATPFSWNSTAA